MTLAAPRAMILQKAQRLRAGFTSCVIVGTSLTSHAQSRPPGDAVQRAIAVVGGEEMLKQVHVFKTTEHRLLFHVQEAQGWKPPFAPDYVSAEQWVDIANPAIRSEITVAAATGDQRTSMLVARDGYSLTRSTFNGQSTGQRFGIEPPRWQLEDPVLVLMRAMHSADRRTLAPAQLQGAEHDRIAFDDHGYRVTLWINRFNSHLDAVDIFGTDTRDMFWNEWGDVSLRVMYSLWTYDGGGLHYPHQWDIYFNGALQETRSIDRLSTNPDMHAIDMTVPAEAHQTQPGPSIDDFPLGRSDRPIAEIAPAVVQIPGNWYVTLVRQPDGIVVIDAPISNGYSRKVLDEIGRRFPGESVKALVTTTSFWWHIAGVREYAARGIPIYANDRNAPLIQTLLDAPHTIAPDALQKAGTRPKAIAVGENSFLGEGPNRVELCPIRQSTSDMLMVWFPDRKLLHTAEMAQPLGPNGSFLFPESLLELQRSVADNRFAVDTIIGMHMGPTPWQKIVDALADAARHDGL